MLGFIRDLLLRQLLHYAMFSRINSRLAMLSWFCLCVLNLSFCVLVLHYEKGTNVEQNEIRFTAVMLKVNFAGLLNRPVCILTQK